ncbi:MAG: TIGR03564 family F420-dependent LLM class oxidoreductase [Deltaproteobacteria bacterium]
MKIGIGIGELSGSPVSLAGLMAQAKEAEADGFASAWVPNIFGLDGITVCALAGQVTQRIELGTAVVPSYPRHPTAMAQQALTANAACGGRFTLGIGLSHQLVIEGMLGMSWARPFSHMKEYVESIRPLLAGEPVSHDGKEYRINAQLGFSGLKKTSLMIAALAPKMLGLAGAQTDGTITWMTGVNTIRDHVAPRLNEAADAAGRDKPRIVCGLPVAICDDAAQGREVAAKSFVIYGSLPSYRAMLDREGAAGPGDVAIVGTEDEVREQLAGLADAGVTDFLAAPFPAEADSAGSLSRTREFLKGEL